MERVRVWQGTIFDARYLAERCMAANKVFISTIFLAPFGGLLKKDELENHQTFAHCRRVHRRCIAICR